MQWRSISVTGTTDSSGATGATVTVIACTVTDERHQCRRVVPGHVNATTLDDSGHAARRHQRQDAVDHFGDGSWRLERTSREPCSTSQPRHLHRDGHSPRHGQHTVRPLVIDGSGHQATPTRRGHRDANSITWTDVGRRCAGRSSVKRLHCTSSPSRSTARRRVDVVADSSAVSGGVPGLKADATMRPRGRSVRTAAMPAAGRRSHCRCCVRQTVAGHVPDVARASIEFTTRSIWCRRARWRRSRS